jgi:hypothetical protein
MRAIGLRQPVGLDPSRPEGPPESALYTTTEIVLLLVAAVAFIDGVIHIGAAVDHFGEFPIYTLAFAVLALVQIAWATMILRRPSRLVLLSGCAFTVSIVGLWVVSRTIGVPIAPRAWVPEEVGVADLVETVGEIATVIAVLSLVLSSRHRFARHVTERIAPVLIGVLFLSVLYGAGAHAA